MLMEPRELCYLPATQLAVAIRTKELSAIEVCDAILYRIRQLNPKLNAYCTAIAEAARAAAHGAETAVMRGESLGPLHGVPFSIKDLTPTKGIRTTFGSKIFEHHVPDEDAILVERLRADGAVLLGKTNTPEFGCKGFTDNKIFGTTYNPWHLDRTPGGSSGGAGASVAAGLGTLAEGSDLAGSIRIPASFCGVVGFKPSQGRIPHYPNRHSWNTLSVHGPITRTVADAALMFQTMAGPDPRDPLSLPDSGEDFLSVVQGHLRLKGMRVAWSPDLGGMAPVEPDIEAICFSAARLFEAFGCHVEEASPDVHDAHEIFAVLNASLRTASVGDYAEAWEEEMDPLLMWRLEQGRQLTLADVHRAEAARMALYHRVRAFFEIYDLLLLPTTGTLPYPVGDGYPAQVAGRAITTPYELLILTYIFNLTGQPAISVPAGWTPDGLPVGLQIVAPFRADSLVLHAAAAFEAARPWYHRQPPLDTPPPYATFSLNIV
jgi:Asp-tRNA(Asn)/Glu-tRNA(Gln) amidotransferase A subunit family amidase